MVEGTEQLLLELTNSQQRPLNSVSSRFLLVPYFVCISLLLFLAFSGW